MSFLRIPLLLKTRAKLLYFLKDILLFYTFAAIFLKSTMMLGFVANNNPRILNMEKGFNNVHYPLYFICFIVVLLSLCYLFKGRLHAWFLVILNFFISFIFIIDLWYFRAFGTFISLHLLKQTGNLDDLSDSIISMMTPWDILFILDIFVLIFILIKKRSLYRNMGRHLLAFTLLFIVSAGIVTYVPFKVNVLGKDDKMAFLYEITWRPDITMFRLSPIGYHMVDTYVYWKDRQNLKLKPEEVAEIKDWFDKKKENLPDNEYKGLYKGKNLLYLQMESLESFVIGQKVNNQEITPNLNKLLKNSIYFPNTREQINLGTSSDAHLMVNTSVYPIRRSATFFDYPNTTYNSLPKLLQKQGYSTTVLHGDKGSYWNWLEGLKSIGFENCVDASGFKQDEMILLGLSDGSFLKQAEPMVVKQKQPFFTHVITMSSHAPFSIPDKYKELLLPQQLKDTKLGDYFQSIHYVDKQIGSFLTNLEKEGILDNTVVCIFGDHNGVHKFYPYSILSINPSEEWWLYNSNRIPLIIYQKNSTGKKFEITGGQIDIMPTILYLMGIDEKEYIDTAMGRNLLKTKKDFAVLANGSYIGNNDNSEEKQHAIQGLNIADKIIRSDYFKKYYPKINESQN